MSKLEVKNEKALPQRQEVLNNFRIPTVYSKEAFNSALKYKPCSDDLFIVTYPRSGTTWVQSIVACIYRNGRPFESALDYLSNSPFLGMSGAEAVETMTRPGAIKDTYLLRVSTIVNWSTHKATGACCYNFSWNIETTNKF